MMASAINAAAHHTNGKAASQTIHSDLPLLLTGKVHPVLSSAGLLLGNYPLPYLMPVTFHFPNSHGSGRCHPQKIPSLKVRAAFPFHPSMQPRRSFVPLGYLCLMPCACLLSLSHSFMAFLLSDQKDRHPACPLPCPIGPVPCVHDTH